MKPVLQVNVSKIPTGSWFECLHDQFIVVQTNDKDEPAFRVLQSENDRRERIATALLAASLSNSACAPQWPGVHVEIAIRLADDLIKELDK